MTREELREKKLRRINPTINERVNNKLNKIKSKWDKMWKYAPGLMITILCAICILNCFLK